MFTNYLFLLLLGTTVLYLAPDRDEILIGVLILLIVSLLVETVGKNLTSALDEERKKIKLKFDTYFYLKRKVNLDNLKILNESIKIYPKKAALMEEYVDQDFHQNFSSDLKNRMVADILKKNYKDFENHKELIKQINEEAENLIRLKIIGDFKESIEKNGT